MASTQTDIYYAFLTALGVITLLLLVCVFSIFRHQKRRQIWLRSLSKREQLLLEKERERVAVDLHDDFGSVIAAVSLGLDDLSERYPDDIVIPRTRGHLHHSLSKLREISHNLLPKTLKRDGFCAAMVNMAEEINVSNRITMKFQGECSDEGFDPDMAVLLYRVIQEIITNAIKHAEATGIVVRMELINGRMNITVSDNGKGFLYEEALATSKSLGLQNIRSRLNALNSTCTVESSAGKGTRYHFTIPIINLQTQHGNNRQDPHYRGG